MKRNTSIFSFHYLVFTAQAEGAEQLLANTSCFLSRRRGSTGEVSTAEKHVLSLVQKYLIQKHLMQMFCITSPVDEFKRLNYCLVVMFCLNQAFHRFLLLCGQPADSQPGDADDVKRVSEVKTCS